MKPNNGKPIYRDRQEAGLIDEIEQGVVWMLDPTTLRAIAAIERVVFSAWLIVWRESMKPNSVLTHLDQLEALRRQKAMLKLTGGINGIPSVTPDEIIQTWLKTMVR